MTATGITRAVSLAQLKLQLAGLVARASSDADVVSAIADIRALLGDLSLAVDVTTYGAVGDGVTDDSAAIQAAVTALNATGGVVWFPPALKYAIGTTIDVRSKAPIYLMSRMGPSAGPNYGIADLAFGGYIKPLNALPNGIIRFSAPAGAAARTEHGSGGCIGLHFADPGNRATSILAAINAIDFDLGVIRDCYFHWLLGSAIQLDQSIMSSVDRCVIRYCGDTAKSALLMGVTNAGANVVQSTTVRDCRLESNYLAPYITILGSGNAGGNKIIGCGFESDTATANTQQTYIDDAGAGNFVQSCHFNRNSARALKLGGNDGVVGDCVFAGDATAMAVPTIDLVAASRRYSLSGLTLRGYSAQVANCIKDVGQWNQIANMSLYITGNIDLSGAVGSRLSNVQVLSPVTTQTYAITIGDSCVAIGCLVDGGSAGAFKGFGLAAATAPRAIGCVAKNLNNTDAFVLLSSNGSIIGCDGFNLGTGKVVGTYTAGGEWIGGPLALRGSAVIDAASLAGGAGVVLGTTIAVAGAALGDAVLVTYSGDTQGLIVAGEVSAAGTVKVSMYNPTVGAVDLASGTFTARVFK